MCKIDQLVYDANSETLTGQFADIAACRHFYTERVNTRVHVFDTLAEAEEPLEKTRLYGPFSLDVVDWVLRLSRVGLVKMFVGADGREVIEY